LSDTSTSSCWRDVIAHQRLRPQRLTTMHARTGENEIPIGCIRCLFPPGLKSCERFVIEWHDFLALFGFHRPHMLLPYRLVHVDRVCLKVNVLPLHGQNSPRRMPVDKPTSTRVLSSRPSSERRRCNSSTVSGTGMRSRFALWRTARMGFSFIQP